MVTVGQAFVLVGLGHLFLLPDAFHFDRFASICKDTFMSSVFTHFATKSTTLAPSFKRAVLIAALCFATAVPARAKTYEVDRLDDANVGACTAAANDCTLRGAINMTEASPGVGERRSSGSGRLSATTRSKQSRFPVHSINVWLR